MRESVEASRDSRGILKNSACVMSGDKHSFVSLVSERHFHLKLLSSYFAGSSKHVDITEQKQRRNEIISRCC